MIQFEDIKAEIEAAGKNAIEVGGATSPLCPTALQVDKYRSLEDMYRQNGRLDAWNKFSKFLKEEEPESLEPYAASLPDGIIADAQSLPFPNETITHVITMCFPWYGPSKDIAWIERILLEYHRVLKSDGKVLILAHSNGKSDNEHKDIAEKLGFRSENIVGSFAYNKPRTFIGITKLGKKIKHQVSTEYFNGIVLTK